MPQTDVLVVGAGSSGVAAAVTAAEEGAATLLVEAAGEVGGTLAWQLLEHSAGFHDGSGRPVVGGFGQRLVDRLQWSGSSPGHVRDDTGYTATRVPINHAELPLVEASMLADAGVELWLESPAVNVDRVGGAIRAVQIETPEGRRTVTPKMVVDCSGDAHVANLANAPFQSDGRGQQQPASMLFKLANVDFGALLEYARAHSEDLRQGSTVGDVADETVNLWGFGHLLAAGEKAGDLSFARSEMHLAGWPRRHELVVNLTRVPTNGWDGDDKGHAYIELSRQILEAVRWFRRAVPGCGDCYIAASAARIGIRESRRLAGHTTLTEADLRNQRRFSEVIARGAFPLDIHDRERPGLSHTCPLSGAFDIPYGCLYTDELDNLLVAGRIISSTHVANGSVRITGTCFATGEAAGAAAAFAAGQRLSTTKIDVLELQHILRRRGAILSGLT